MLIRQSGLRCEVRTAHSSRCPLWMVSVGGANNVSSTVTARQTLPVLGHDALHGELKCGGEQQQFICAVEFYDGGICLQSQQS